MKTLLRSCFVSAEDQNEHILQNISRMRESGLGFEQDNDTILWEYICDFVGKYGHPPDLSTLRTFYSSTNSDEMVNRVEYLASQKSRIQGAFVVHLEQKADDRRRVRVSEILAEAGNILRTGIQVKEKGSPDLKLVKGPRDAIHYIIENSREIVAPTTGQMLSGTVNDDAEEVLAAYQRVKADPHSGKGQLTGIGQIDEILPGAKRQELWLHAAFTGGMM